MLTSYPLTSAASTVQPRQPVVGGQIVQSLQHSIADPDALVQEAGEQCLQPRPTVEIVVVTVMSLVFIRKTTHSINNWATILRI